jgi:N-methylhydantoinase A/oxoprolinase/acetone carboxylase beta subunit
MGACGICWEGKMRIGIDVGGTFTDVILVDEKVGKFCYTKTPTTHQDLAEGVLKGVLLYKNADNASGFGRRCLERFGGDP